MDNKGSDLSPKDKLDISKALANFTPQQLAYCIKWLIAQQYIKSDFDFDQTINKISNNIESQNKNFNSFKTEINEKLLKQLDSFKSEIENNTNELKGFKTLVNLVVEKSLTMYKYILTLLGGIFIGYYFFYVAYLASEKIGGYPFYYLLTAAVIFGCLLSYFIPKFLIKLHIIDKKIL